MILIKYLNEIVERFCINVDPCVAKHLRSHIVVMLFFSPRVICMTTVVHSFQDTAILMKIW